MSTLPKLNATPKYELTIPSTSCKTVKYPSLLNKRRKILLLHLSQKTKNNQ